VTAGPKVQRFEADFAAYVGARHAIAVSSCTAALHIALTALGIGPGDEVILPTLTFCSTANVVVHLGARPALVDVDDDFNLRPEAVEAAITEHTRAIVPVHYGGQACDLDEIRTIALRHNLPVVEDAAHAVGAEYHGRKIGTAWEPQTPNSKSPMARPAGVQLPSADGGPRPHVTCFSFYAIKNLTTGEGGMIVTGDDALAKRMRRLSLHGMSHDAWKRYTGAGSWYYEVQEVGYKNNMTDLQASLGIHQLRKLDGFIERRAEIARRYAEAFAGLAEIDVPVLHADRKHAWHLFVIRLGLERLGIDRAEFIEQLRARNIGTSVHFIPVHLHPFYREHYGYREGDYPCAERLYERIVSLPLYPAMTDDDVEAVVEAVRDVINVNGF
jgi:dTDP-4-amino-4,6-dideoxygalactose transaminase